MTIYPKLSDKEYEALPYAFKEMIKQDERKPIIPNVINIEDIPDTLERMEDWNKNKRSVRIACQNVIEKQRG